MTGFGDEVHVGLLGGAAAFLDVALYAAADDVVPTALATLALRQDVIEGELGGGEFSAAVLALAAIAGVDVAAIEFHILARKFVVAEQADDARDGDLEAHGVNPVEPFGLELCLETGELLPAGEIKVLPLALAGGIGFVWMTSASGAAEQGEGDGRTLMTRIAW